MRLKHGQLMLIRDLWQGKPSDGVANTQFIDQEAIQVNFADILIQANLNGLIDVNLDELHTQIISLIGSDDRYVRMMAVSTLGTFDYCSDVPTLKSIALQEDRSTFRASAISLAGLCCELADATLDELEGIVDSENRKFISKVRNSNRKFKEKSGICE